MATQLGSALEPTSHQDHDMISDAGDIDLDVDFVINTDQVHQEVILTDAPSGLQLPDDIMQEDHRVQDSIVEAHMQDEDNSYNSKMDDPTSNFSSAELDMTDVDEVHIELDFGQHDTLIEDEIQLPGEDEITWNEPAHDYAQDAGKTLDQQGQAAPPSTVVDSSLQIEETITNYIDGNDRLAAPQDTTANPLVASSQGNLLDNSNNSALAPGSQAPTLLSTHQLEQEESENTDHVAEGPEDGGVQLDEISYEEDDDIEEAQAEERDTASDQQQDDFQEGEYSNDDYNAVLHYKGTPIFLFPPSSDSEDLPNMSLLKSSALADSPLPELFRACREALGTDIHADHSLRLEVTCFGLSINEDDSDCPNVTIAQIIDVYYHLNSNDEVYEPSLMEVTLSIQRKLSTQLNDLFKAAEAGKGYKSVQGSNYEFQDSDADHDHATSEEEEASEEDHNTAAEESNQDDGTDLNGLTSADLPRLAAEPDVKTNNTTDNPPGGVVHHGLEHDDQPPEMKLPQSAAVSVSKTESSSKNTVQNEDEDDLIDYTDDEVENEEAAETSRSSTIQDDHPTHEKNDVATDSADIAAETSVPHFGSENNDQEENDDDFLLDFGNDDDPRVGVENDLNPIEASAAPGESTDDGVQTLSSTHLQFELKLGDDSLKENSGDVGVNHADDDPLDFELEFGSGDAPQTEALEAAPSLEDDYNDLIDYDDDDEVPDEQIATITTVPSESPTGKRTWDAHVEGTGADESEKDTKRMKST